MFYVKSKKPESMCDEESNTRKSKKIYAVQYKHGYPFFLLYEKGKWITRSAKHYEPVMIQ